MYIYFYTLLELFCGSMKKRKKCWQKNYLQFSNTSVHNLKKFFFEIYTNFIMFCKKYCRNITCPNA